MNIITMIMMSVLNLNDPCITDVLSCLSNDTSMTTPMGEEINGLAVHSAPVTPLPIIPTLVPVGGYEGDTNVKTASASLLKLEEAREFIQSYVYGNPTDQQAITLLNGLSAEALATVIDIGAVVAGQGE